MSAAFRPEAVITDIDGTLTDKEKRLGPEILDALREVEARGVPVILCTGNVLPIAHTFRLILGLKGPVVAENGAMLMHEGKFHKFGDRRKVEAAFLHLKERLPDVELLITDRWREGEIAVKMRDPDEVRRALDGWPVRVEATGFAVHLMEPHLSKAAGAAKACEMLRLDPRRCVAFGDNENDFPVFDIVGYRVAVANATPELKARADFVAEREFGGGVVDGLRHLGLV